MKDNKELVKYFKDNFSRVEIKKYSNPYSFGDLSNLKFIFKHKKSKLIIEYDTYPKQKYAYTYLDKHQHFMVLTGTTENKIIELINMYNETKIKGLKGYR
jgi:hypothetical protein